MHKNLLDHKNGCDQSAKVVHEEYEEGTRQALRVSTLQVLLQRHCRNMRAEQFPVPRFLLVLGPDCS